MFRPIQPKFKIRVYNGKRVDVDTLKGSKVVVSSDESYIDIEQCAAYPVEYEEQANLLNTLKFTVDKYADLLIYYFFIGQAVKFYGGYYADGSGKGMRHVFSGTVTRIRTSFSDSGRVSFTVECMNYGYTKMGKDQKYFVYPDKNSARSFAKADSLSIEDVVRGIANENGVEIGTINISSEAKSKKLVKTNIEYQKGESDWQFLTKLAQKFGCNVWISDDDGTERLNFVSHEKAFRSQSDIGFLYPIYNISLLDNSGSGGDIKDYEVQRFDNPAYNRPRILRNVTVDEDISQAYAVSRSAMYYDKETGEYREAVSMIETDKNGNKTITFYELDEARVAYVHQNMPELADKIRDGSPTGMEWGVAGDNNPEHANYYYRAVKVYDEQTAVFDRAFFGITVTATCNQDLDIRSQRTYKVRGILSYHSKDLETSFFLRGLKHVWDSDGTRTELDFIR